ncbi:hypothetical protein [Fulvivirga kasyanovii]|uniref:hypothetical protein n=1 Tax=Fulvivirga kasyanovii TaxID=396812 RepID=UPI0031DFE16D
MRMINNEMIKALNNRPYWFAITFYMIFCVLALFRVLIVDARTDLIGSLNDMMGLSIVVVLLMTFIITNNIGLDFKHKSIKFEIISGLTRKEKFISNLVAVAMHAFMLTLFLFLLSEIYYLIVNGHLVLFRLSVLNFFLTYFLWSFIFSCFVNAVVLLTKHGTGAFFIVFVYLIIEVLLVEANVLSLEAEAVEKLSSYLLLGSIFNLLISDLFALESFRTVAIPLLYLVLFSGISYFRIKSMSVNE